MTVAKFYWCQDEECQFCFRVIVECKSVSSVLETWSMGIILEHRSLSEELHLAVYKWRYHWQHGPRLDKRNQKSFLLIEIATKAQNIRNKIH